MSKEVQEDNGYIETLRDVFAGQALCGMMSTDGYQNGIDEGTSYEDSDRGMALCAYALADAMIEARSKKIERKS